MVTRVLIYSTLYSNETFVPLKSTMWNLMALGLLVSEISHFCCKYFLYGQDIFDQTIISIIEHCHWCWYDIFSWQLSVLKTRPPCDLKLPDREMNVFRTGHFFVTSSSLIWYINFCPVIIVIQTTGYFRYVITLEYPSLTHVSSYSNNGITKKTNNRSPFK